MDLISKLKLKIGIQPKPDKWCFIVGCYNSGTTLISRILSNHQEIGAMKQEGQYLTKHLPRPDQVGLARLWALDPEQFIWKENEEHPVEEIQKDWFNYMSKPFAPILLEKSPPNVAKIKWINKNFNNPHFIVLVRNGYAVSEGITRKTNHSIEKSAAQWAVSNKYLGDFISDTKHTIIKYEDMVGNPEETFNKITSFLNTDPLPKVVFEKNFKIHERNEVIENKNKLSFKNLTKDDITLINPIIKEQMEFWDYKLLENS